MITTTPNAILGTNNPLQTTLTSNDSAISELISTASVISTRSIIHGGLDNNRFIPVNVSEKGHLEVEIHGPQTAFGEISTAPNFAQIQEAFTYGIDPKQITTVLQNGGTAYINNCLMTLTTSASTGSIASFRTNDILKYQPGAGSLIRFTAIFDQQVVGATQTVGVGNGETGLFYGSSGDGVFGVMRVAFQTREIRQLVITTKSSTVQNATITLADIQYAVPLTNTPSTTGTAYEISQFDFTTKYPGWRCSSIGNTAYFVSLVSGQQTGTFNINGTAVTGSFSTLVQGAATGTTELIRQSSWNIDVCDGTGSSANPSNINLDITKGNVYYIKFQYLGFGNIEFGIEEKQTGELIPVHFIKYPNTNTIPNLSNPSFPFIATTRNVTNNTEMSLKIASLAAFSQASNSKKPKTKAYTATKLGVDTNSIQPIFTLRNALLLNNKINQSKIIPFDINISNVGTKGATIYIFEDAPISGLTSFSKINASNSIAEVDTTTTAITDNVAAYIIGVAASTQTRINLKEVGDEMSPGSTITIAAKAYNTTTDIIASIQWQEDK